jgi:hypothetical protein
MLQNQVNKYLSTEQSSSANKVETSISHGRRDDHEGYRWSRSINRHRHHHPPEHSNRRSYALSRSASSPSMCPVRSKRWRHGSHSLQGNLRKIKPRSFDGENNKGEEVESWLLGMRKYFQLHDYSSNEKSRIVAYPLQGKESMWWDWLKKAKHLDEKRISWR